MFHRKKKHAKKGIEDMMAPLALYVVLFAAVFIMLEFFMLLLVSKYWAT